jgi:hypothetical protein
MTAIYGVLWTLTDDRQAANGMVTSSLQTTVETMDELQRKQLR